MNRKEVAGFRKFIMEQPNKPPVLIDLAIEAKKSYDEIFPSEEELYQELRFVNARDAKNLAVTFAKLFLVRIMMISGVPRAQAEQLASKAIISNKLMIDIWERQIRENMN
jgi:hypothetical protein